MDLNFPVRKDTLNKIARYSMVAMKNWLTIINISTAQISLHVDMVKYAIHLLDYFIFTTIQWYYFLNRCVYPNPPCQLPLWEETGALGENPRLSAERWLTLFTWVRSENRTHDLRGEWRLLCRLCHRSPISSPLHVTQPTVIFFSAECCAPNDNFDLSVCKFNFH
jgi:hypothetical protein